MRALLNRFVKDETGATAIEYGLLAALIAVAIVATLQLIGPKLNGAYKQVETALPA